MGEFDEWDPGEYDEIDAKSDSVWFDLHFGEVIRLLTDNQTPPLTLDEVQQAINRILLLHLQQHHAEYNIRFGKPRNRDEEQ